MNARTLLEEMRRRGVEVALQGENIAYRAPRGVMSEKLLASFQSQKEQIIRELRTESDDDPVFEQWAQSLSGDDRPASPHPYARYVEPLKSRLLKQVGLDINFVRGEGHYLWDSEGNRYLDCISQYGALPFGYNPDVIWDALFAVRERRLPNVATQTMLDSAGLLAAELLRLLPDSFQHVVFCNSGAEATEVALKLCRAATGRAKVLSTHHGFHGLTTGALAATGHAGFQNGFFVQSEYFRQIPFGDASSLQRILESHPQRIAAFVVEPIQGEAGIIIPPTGYLRDVRELCDQHDVLMVVDEVQTGLGRTGSMFAFEHDGVVPDVIMMAKALGGGLFPIGAVGCTPRAYSTRFGIRHSSTLAGNACGCECGLATLAMLQANDGQLLGQVRQVGEQLLAGLTRVQRRFPQLVRGVRGRGLMAAIEFEFDSLKDRNGLLPVLAEQHLLLHLIVSYLLRVHRVRVAATFMGRTVLRVEPALTFTREECEILIRALDDAIANLADENAAAFVASMIDLTAVDVLNRKPQLNGGGLRITRVETRPIDNVQPAEARKVGEFGFLVHLTDILDLVDFDWSLAVFYPEELHRLKKALTRSSQPTLIGANDICSVDGTWVRGQFVLVPYTPAELIAMPKKVAIDWVQRAADLVAKQNVKVIGLGGFTSVLTSGGLALDARSLPPLTSGNALTVWAGLTAIKSVLREGSRSLDGLNVAVVGAAGQIGRAMSLMLSRHARRIILVGRDGAHENSQQRLRAVACAVAEDKISISDRCQSERDVEEIADESIGKGTIVLAENIRQIADADVIVAASSAIEPIIQSAFVKPGAIVCDLARPASVSDEVKSQRPDVRWLEGGLIRARSTKPFGLFAGPFPNVLYACVAETALWTLQTDLGAPSAVQFLQPGQITALGRAAARHGFEVSW